MEWTAPTLWWLVAGVLVAAELASATFYLLMLALGAAAAALAAHLGAAFTVQLLAAALVGGGAVALWHQARTRRPAAPPPSANRDINLDIGTPVHVGHWNQDGMARVSYRGASWTARFAGDGPPQPGRHVIREVDGTLLVLDRAAS